jgi:hypothetical protein
MKPLIWGGILFIVLGGFAFAYQGFNYTHQEKVLDVGPIHATAEKHEHVSISPIVATEKPIRSENTEVLVIC